MITLADRIWDGHEALSELENELDDAKIEYEKISHDWYDSSLELHGVRDDFRLTGAQQQVIRNAGFSQVYVNHKNKWETHYGWRKAGFPVSGWRVSYPHKRGEKGGSILVEDRTTGWPEDWFKTGYVKIVEPQAGG